MSLARRPAAFSAVLLTAGALGAGVALAASGDQDPAFNDGAPAVVDFPNSGDDYVRDLAVGPAHNVSLLAEQRLLERQRALVTGGEVDLARVGSDGVVIDGFGDHGFKADPFEDMRISGPRVVAVDKDDNTLVGFSSGDDPRVDTLSAWGGDEEVDGDFTVARYLPSGERDGVSHVRLPGARDARVVGVVPQADGSTLVAGTVFGDDGAIDRAVVVRLTDTGARDTQYGGEGEAAIADAYMIGAGSQPGGPAGSIVTVSGLGYDEATDGFAQLVVRRFLAGGSVDETFGGTFDNPVGGYLYGNVGGFVGRDGRLYVYNVNGSVARYDADGKRDEAYGTGGVLKVDGALTFGGDAEVGADAQADGKLVVTGFEGARGLDGDNASGAVVARFKADGSGLDPDFADGGLFHLPVPAGQDADDAYANQVVVQDDGKIVVGGSFERAYQTGTDLKRALEPGETQAFVLRLGTGGTVTTPTDTTPTGTTTTTTTTTATTTTVAATTPAPTTTAAAAPVAAQSKPAPRACASRRSFSIRLRIPKGAKPVSAVVKVNGKKVKTLKGKRITAPVDLRGLVKGRFTVSITVRLSNGKTLTGARRYKTCTPKSGAETIPVL